MRSKMALREQVVDELRSSHPSVGVQKAKDTCQKGNLLVVRLYPSFSRTRAYQKDFGNWVPTKPGLATDVFAPTIVQLREVRSVCSLYSYFEDENV